MTTSIARWTLADYHAMIDAGLLVNRRIELLNGFIIEMPPEGPDHADLSTDAIELLIGEANGRYRVRPAKPIAIAGSNSEPEPDIAVVKPQSYRKSHPTPEDIYLLIEFSKSSLAYDTEDKRRTYAAAGIQEYWVVNLRNQQLIVYRNPSGGDYQSEQQLTTGFLSPLAFPDVRLDIGTFLNN